MLVLGSRAYAQSPPAAGSHGSEAEACFEAAERAQPLMRDRRFRAAAQQLAVCAREACPRAARSDCRAWTDELTRAQPTVVFRAREARPGGDVALDEVRVWVDGEPLVTPIVEAPVALDPGAHALRFEHAGLAAVEQRIELREGEARRVVDVVFHSAGEPQAAGPAPIVRAPPAAPPVSATSPGVASSHSPVAPRYDAGGPSDPAPTSTWALLGGGGTALAVGITFEAIGLTSRTHLADTCGVARSCAQADVDAARGQVLVGDLAVGVGAALLLGAGYVYLTRARGPAAPGPSARFGLRPVAGGLAGAIEGSL